MNSNFKDSFYKILADTQLKDKLNKAITVEEVYNVFKSAGYGEGQEELEGEIRDVIRNFVKHKDASASEEDLSQVAGGKGPGAIKKMSAAALALMGVASAAATSTHAAPGGFENAKSTVNKYLQNRRTRNMITHATALVGGAGLGAVVMMGAGWLFFGGKGGSNGFENLKNIDIALGKACDIIKDIVSKTAAAAKDEKGAKVNLDSALGAVKGQITTLANTMKKQGLLVRNFNVDEFIGSLEERYTDADGVAKGLIALFMNLNLQNGCLPKESSESAVGNFMGWAAGVHVMIQSRLQEEFEVGNNGVSLKDFIESKGEELAITEAVQNKLFKDMQGNSNPQNNALFAGVMTAIEKSGKNRINEEAYKTFVNKLGDLNAFNRSFLNNTDSNHVDGMLSWLATMLGEGAGGDASKFLNYLTEKQGENFRNADSIKLVKDVLKGETVSVENFEKVKDAVDGFAGELAYFKDKNTKGVEVPPALKTLATQVDSLKNKLAELERTWYAYNKKGDGAATAKKDAVIGILGDLATTVPTGVEFKDGNAGTAYTNAIAATDLDANKAINALTALKDQIKDYAAEKAAAEKAEAAKAAKAAAEAAAKKAAAATGFMGEIEEKVKELNVINGALDSGKLGIDTAAINAIIA